MESIEDGPSNRRSFLAQLGKTLGLGLGLGLLMSTNAGARTNACAIWCYPTNCGGCGSGCYQYHCDTMCGYSFDDCLAHDSCSAFCYATNYC